jgi:hypothetical protein
MDIKVLNGERFDYGGETLHFFIGEYVGGMPAIQVVCDDGELYATITTNLSEQEQERLNPGEFFVKTWTENEAITRHLIGLEDFFIDTGRRVSIGHAVAHIWKINPTWNPAKELISQAAEASEMMGDDELEDFARLQQLELNHDERADFLVEVLGIQFHREKFGVDPRAMTMWGKKTRKGVRETIKTIMYKVENWKTA